MLHTRTWQSNHEGPEKDIEMQWHVDTYKIGIMQVVVFPMMLYGSKKYDFEEAG